MNTHQEYLVEPPVVLLCRWTIQLLRVLHVGYEHPAGLGYSPFHFHNYIGQNAAPLN